MTTYINFQPPPLTPFQFSATLDGADYNCIVTWNFEDQTWYLNIYTQLGVLVTAIRVAASPNNFNVNLVFGYFLTSTLIYRAASNQFEISP